MMCVASRRPDKRFVFVIHVEWRKKMEKMVKEKEEKKVLQKGPIYRSICGVWNCPVRREAPCHFWISLSRTRLLHDHDP
jgi:hypothetical protein